MVKRNNKFPSELRYDLVSKDWVVVATGRAKRPEMFKQKSKEHDKQSSKNCPFCLEKNLAKPVLVFNGGKEITNFKGKFPKEWILAVVPNKFPAFIPAKGIKEEIEGGLYKKVSAVGFHEIVLFKDHNLQIAQTPVSRIKSLIDVYQLRYLFLSKEKFVNHISIFHNQGKSAGASIDHPHSQIITTPLVDVDLQRATLNAEKFFKEQGSCIYCLMDKWEMKVKRRLVFENDKFLVVCPFASKTSFEMIISPKNHSAYFEKITEEEKTGLAEAFHAAFFKLDKGLSSPDYNFYLHTAPCDGQKYPFYHWHFTIMPKTSVQAGFEIGTRMEISTIEPEKAAEYLRKIKC